MVSIKNLILPIMLLIAVGFAQAALYVNVVTDEFSLESPYPVQTVKACECGLRTEIAEIRNLGDFDTLFTVQVISPLNEIITLDDNTFALAPGEEKAVHIYINAPCDTSINSYYVIQVSTNYGRSKELYKEFNSQKCQNIKFTSKMLTPEVYPGQEACSQIDLQNVGEFTDTFRLSTTLPYSWPSKDAVELDSDETTRLTLCTRMPVEVFGDVTQPFKITSDKAKNTAYGEEKYKILHDYDFTIKTEEFRLNACEDVPSKSIVTIENLAQTPNEYTLELRAPAFASLSQDKLALDAKESDSVVLSLSPAQKDVGTYNAVIVARSKYGQVQKEKQFEIIVNDCFNTIASLNDAKEVSGRACAGDAAYTLNIVNKGLYEEAYQIIVDSEGWVTVPAEDEFVRLKPAQQVNIPVKAALPEVDATQTSFVAVKQLRAPYQQIEMKLNLESVSPRTCYNVDLLQETYEINYDAKTIPLILQHTGLKGGEYSLKLGELDSKFVDLEDESITLNPGDLAVVHVTPKNYSDYLEGRYLNKLSLEITPVEYDEINYDRQFWVVLKDKGFFAKAWEWLKGINYTAIGLCGFATLILLAVLACLIAGAIYTQRKEKIRRIKASKVKKLRAFNMVLVALLLFGLLMLVFLGAPDEGRFFEGNSNETSPLFHEWRQNQQYTLDLDNYFSDPDLDNLTYSATQPGHIQARIDGSSVTLTPEHGWSGEEVIVFTASDSKGGVTDSEVMTLRVVERKPMGWLDYWSLYCKQINITLIMLCLLVVLMITDLIEEKGFRKYSKKN